MLKIFKLCPKPELRGDFEDGILKLINQDPIKVTEEEVLMRFNRGYWRVSA